MIRGANDRHDNYSTAVSVGPLGVYSHDGFNNCLMASSNLPFHSIELYQQQSNVDAHRKSCIKNLSVHSTSEMDVSKSPTFRSF